MDLYLLIMLLILMVRILFIRPQKKVEPRTRRPHYGIISQTNEGHLVRSRGEKRIADFLSSKGIVYMYEPKLGPWKPDFYLPDFRLVIEYYGMANIEGRDGELYRKKMVEKNQFYIRNHIQVLSIMPQHMIKGEYMRMINQFLKINRN